MSEQNSGNSLSSNLEILLEVKNKEIECLKSEIMKLQSLLETSQKFCSKCAAECCDIDPAEPEHGKPLQKLSNEKHELYREEDITSAQTGPCDVKLRSCHAETQTFETDFLGIDSSGSAEDWKLPEGSNCTVADLVKEVVEQKSQESDYVYDENYNMYYSKSTGYYFDTENNLLYEPHSRTYYRYNSETSKYEFHSQVELGNEQQAVSAETIDALVGDLTDCTKENGTSSEGQNGEEQQKQQTKKKVSKTSPANDNSVSDGEELKNAHKSSNLKIDEEKDDASSLEEGELGSPYTESTTTEGSYYLSSVSSPASVNFDEDSAESWPPCIRLIVEESNKLQIGSLLLITCTGAVVGRDKKCRLCIPDISVSKIHAETLYNNETCEYYVTDVGSQNGTFINGTRLSQPKEKSSPHILKHGDYICFGFCKLLVHIHPGTETCDDCEPGQVQAKYNEQYNEQTEKCVPLVQTKAEKEKERRRQLRQLKKKFGLQNMTYEQDSSSIKAPSTNYQDRAKERQKTKGSDNPHEKTAEPASLNTTIPSDNKGYQLLKKMGWKEGEALGAKPSTGETEPVPLSIRKSRAGLGSASTTDNSEVPLNPRNKKWRKAQRRYYGTTQESSCFLSGSPKFVEATEDL